MKSHLNERLLQQIAGATEGGFYLPLRGAKVIDTLYDQGLAKLPKSQHQEKFVRQYHERYHWPLAVAIVLLLVEMLFPERKRMSPPSPRKTRSRRSLLRPVLRPEFLGQQPIQAARLSPPVAIRPPLPFVYFVYFVVPPSPAPVSASPSSALREYKAGKYDQALKEYERLLKKKNDDPRLHFNAGAAAYRNQQFDEAAKQFNATLASPDLKLQGLAYYNEGNALYHLGEQNPDPKKRTEAWEKALQDYQSTMKLNPQDADAKFNYDFVKKRLEELKQQQQQQSQQNNQDQKQNQDQQKQQNSSSSSRTSRSRSNSNSSSNRTSNSKPSRSRSRIHPSRSNPPSRRNRTSKSRPPRNPRSRSKNSSRPNSKPASRRRNPTRRIRKPPKLRRWPR